MEGRDAPAGNQPEFWKTVKENGVYPGLESELTNIDFYQFSNYELQTTEETQESRRNRCTRFYARKLTNVRFAETIGNQSLTYTETDEFEHLFVLDIRLQPDEGDVMVCKRSNSKLFAFGTADRGYGGTYVPPTNFKGYLKIKDSFLFAPDGNNPRPIYGRVVGRYYPSVYGVQPTHLRFVMTSGPSSIPDTTIVTPLQDSLLLNFDTGLVLGDDLGGGYRFDVYGILGALEEKLAESLIVDVPSPYHGPYRGYF